MNKFFYINLEDYLRQWLSHLHGEPVLFPKNSLENDVIEMGLTKLGEKNQPEVKKPNDIAIVIPNFKYKPTKTYNFLPKEHKAALVTLIRRRFRRSLWQDLHKFGFIGRKKSQLILAWMKSNGIEENDRNFNTIAKIYIRMWKNSKKKWTR